VGSRHAQVPRHGLRSQLEPLGRPRPPGAKALQMRGGHPGQWDGTPDWERVEQCEGVLELLLDLLHGAAEAGPRSRATPRCPGTASAASSSHWVARVPRARKRSRWWDGTPDWERVEQCEGVLELLLDLLHGAAEAGPGSERAVAPRPGAPARPPQPARATGSPASPGRESALGVRTKAVGRAPAMSEKKICDLRDSRNKRQRPLVAAAADLFWAAGDNVDLSSLDEAPDSPSERL
jgi:hypothetical protein